MATHLQNFNMILTGVLGISPTNEQLSAVADAALTKVTDKELLEFFPNDTRETLTANQRAYVANIIVRKLIRRLVRTSKVAAARIANIPALTAAASDETI